jgi:RHS repeat-associated protein
VTFRNPAQGVTIGYGYNVFHDRTVMTSNKITGQYAYSHYDNYLLNTVTDPNGETTTRHFTAVDRLKNIDYANGASTTFIYNIQNHRLTAIKHFDGPNEILAQYLMDQSDSYDAVGNIKKVKDLVGTTTFNYDAINRLTSASYPGPRGTNSYGYDAAGNRTTHTINGTPNTYSYHSSGGSRLMSALGESFTYDGSGNMTQKGSNTYVWDALDRLVSVTTPSKSVSYIYDGFNRRVRKIDLTNGITTNYAFDGLSVLLETDAGGNTKTVYNPGISVTDSNGNKFYYLHDDLGNVTHLVDKDQNIVQNYTYDAFGAQVGVTDDANGYRFVGGYDVLSDDDIGLQYMWNRWYDPEVGRFISRDPIGFEGGINLYAYVETVGKPPRG